MKKALMVWGGWDGHEPQQCVERFVPFLRASGYEVDVRDSLDVFGDGSALAAADLAGDRLRVWAAVGGDVAGVDSGLRAV